MNNSVKAEHDTTGGMTPQTIIALRVEPLEKDCAPRTKRKTVDWVAAGRKAWETRRRNAAARRAETTA